MTRDGKALSLVVFLVLCSVAFGAPGKPATLSEELERLGVHTVLLIPSQAVDESPVWSPDSRYLAANLAGTWYTVDTSELQLEPAKWRKQQRIGALLKPKLEKAKPELPGEWRENLVQGSREVSTRTGTRLSLSQKELSTRFVIQEKGKPPHTLWQTDFENCHSLALSPTQRFVAFICELNGVVVTDLSRLRKELR